MRIQPIEAFLVAVIVLIVAAVTYSSYRETKRQIIEIKKDDWDCTKTENRMKFQQTTIDIDGINTNNL